MAPRDRTTDTHDGSDDWFDDPAVTEPTIATAPAAPSRRLSVLADHEPIAADHDDHDSWFVDSDGETVAGDHNEFHDPHHDPTGSPVDPSGSFDTQTSVLRAQGPRDTPQPTRSWWKRHRSAVAVTCALAVLAGVITGAGVLLTGMTDDTQVPEAMALDDIVTATAGPTSAAPAAAGAAAADVTWCTGQADGDPVTDSSADPGAAAIWRFEKAFYFDRDGAAARAAGAPDAVMASAQRLQQGIDQLEPEVEFCVLADPVDAGIYDVTVVERGPGIDGRMSRQRITTTEQQDGQTLITAIVPR